MKSPRVIRVIVPLIVFASFMLPTATVQAGTVGQVAAVLVGPPAPPGGAVHLCSWKPPRPRIAPAAAIYFGGQALDFATTEVGLARGLREGNPLMQRRDVRVAEALVAATAFTALDVWAQRRGHSTKRWRVAYIAAHVAIVGWNVRKIAGQD